MKREDNNDVQFCNTTNLDNELQKNLEVNENNDENVTDFLDQFFWARTDQFFMRSVFLGKNAAHWLMSNIEHIVVGVSPKQFFTLREGDTAFTLQ